MKMEIKQLGIEEYILHEAMCHNVFFSFGGERENFREKLKDENFNPLDNEDYKDYYCWGIKQDGKLVSALQITPYTMRMNDYDVSMAGIGGVVTLPESRGNGYVSKLMDKILHESLNQGIEFSVLYPFSYEYYRKFGYEMCFTLNNVTIPIQQFSSYSYPQSIKAHEPEDSLMPFKEIYESFCENRNFAIVRDDKSWKKLLDRDLYKNLEYTYLYYNNKNKATAYILYKCDYNPSIGNTLKIEELCWSEPAGLHGILGFLGKLGSEYQRVEWNMPSDVDAFTMFPDGYDVSWKRSSRGMCRIVNVLTSLNALSAPEGAGNIVIEVEDSFLHENTGKYNIEWHDKQLNVEMCNTKSSMTTSIQTLTQLVTGYLTPAEAVNKKDTVVSNSYTELIKLFPRRNLYIKESF